MALLGTLLLSDWHVAQEGYGESESQQLISFKVKVSRQQVDTDG